MAGRKKAKELVLEGLEKPPPFYEDGRTRVEPVRGGPPHKPPRYPNGRRHNHPWSPPQELATGIIYSTAGNYREAGFYQREDVVSQKELERSVAYWICQWGEMLPVANLHWKCFNNTFHRIQTEIVGRGRKDDIHSPEHNIDDYIDHAFTGVRTRQPVAYVEHMTYIRFRTNKRCKGRIDLSVLMRYFHRDPKDKKEKAWVEGLTNDKEPVEGRRAWTRPPGCGVRAAFGLLFNMKDKTPLVDTFASYRALVRERVRGLILAIAEDDKFTGPWPSKESIRASADTQGK